MPKKTKENRYLVYKYISPSGKIYIGQTCRPIKVRAGSNGINYRGSKAFYKAILKYGLSNFTIDIVASDLSFEEANYLEKYLIAFYHSSDKRFGYNITEGGDGSLGHPHKLTEKQLEKMRKGLINNKHLSKPVLCVETGITYPSIEEVHRQLGLDQSSVRKCATGVNYKTVGGYHWKYVA